jgi:hypothetical protein
MKRADFLFLPWVVIALAIAVPSPISLRAQVQSSEPHPSFEVASIKHKQNTSDDRRSFGVQPGGRLVVSLLSF